MMPNKNPQLSPLTPEEEHVIVGKGTEAPYSGEYDDFWQEGTYTCRRCGTPLYVSNAKFHSGCGWPSFDQEIAGAVKRLSDADGSRTEIQCATCGAHLGHIFEGEGFTEKNTRHCVNSLSMRFVPTETAIFGGGCFWCTEAVFSRLKGVLSVTSGYAGGKLANPNYFVVSEELTGHAEVVKVEFDPRVITYTQLLDVFFHTHEPTSLNQQGADTGTQYRSIILYTSEQQKKAAEESIAALEKSGEFRTRIVTELKALDQFYTAEEYHQKYYQKNTSQPYCQIVIEPKLEKLLKRYKDLLA